MRAPHLPTTRVAVAAAAAVAVAVGLAAAPARAQADPWEPDAAPVPAATPARGTGAEAEAVARLRALEARLSLGHLPTKAEIDDVVAAAGSRYVPVRALAVAVLAWLEPDTATAPLLAAWSDEEARVRAGAAQSLLSLARRFDDDERRRVVAEALGHLDDPANEVACASAELLAALAPAAAAEAVRTRAEAADDVRYACFARVGGLPLRPVQLPELPVLEPPEEEAPPPAPVRPPPAVVRDDGTLLLVSAGAAAGFVAGALLPAGFVPSRDVLTYDDDASRITREEVAALSQLGAGLLGAAALGAGAWAVTQVDAVDVEEAAGVAIATGALGLAGASAQLAFDLREGPAALATAGGLTLGLAGGLGLAAGFQLDAHDDVLAASAMGLGAFATGLVVFTATPVGLDVVPPFGVKRTDFGLGLAGVGAGLAGFAGLATGAFVDVRPARSFALLAGGALGGGLATAAGFLLVPASDIESRIACGVGLAGLALGVTAGALVPDALLPSLGAASAGPGAAVVVTDGAVALGVPVLAPVAVPGPRGDEPGLGAALVTARF